MKHRAVVASFIFAPRARDQSPTRVALFRRSHHPDIRSYRGLLAPISGSIEAAERDSSATAAAARELREETGLVTGADLRLEAVGPPFSFADEDAGRSWTVYPFGWTLLCGEERVQLDWEHEGWEWVDARQVLGDDPGGGLGLRQRCVPRVEESLRRVYFGKGGAFGGEESMGRGMVAGDAFYAGMGTLRDDKQNGARVLATRAAQCLREVLDGLSETADGAESERERWWRILRVAGWHLVYSARPSMNAAIGSAVVETLSSIQHIIRDRTNSKTTVTSLIDEYVLKRHSASTQLADAFSQYALQQKGDVEAISIVTLSSSSTIKAALVNLIHRRSFKSISISILESRPRCEGASLAASLISALRSTDGPSASANQSIPHISITVAPDSHVASLLSKSPSSSEHGKSKTYLLLGADRISSHGAVLNKTLSLSAAVLARNLTSDGLGAAVVVLAETDKLATIADLELFKQDEARSEEREIGGHEPENGGADEVMAAWLTAGVADSDERVVKDALASEGNERGLVLTVSIQNETFEWVPAKWIDVYITEKGEMRGQEIGNQCMRKTELERGIFTGMYV